MKKQEINDKLLENYQSFANYVVGLNDADFEFTNGEKWTAGQQLDHLCRSVNPLLQAFMMPKLVLGTMFGKADRESMSYNALVEKYQELLANGGKASGKFIPETINANQKETLRNNLLKAVESLIKKADKFSENDLDKYLLPHPLLGKLTLREMLCFTIYHAEHHHKATLRNLELETA
jgi:DinB superfamily